MKKLLEEIGIRLYAVRYEPEYRNKILFNTGIFAAALLLILCIYETAVY